MRMRPEDAQAALDRTKPNDIQCLHRTAVVPIPTPDGFMFAFRVVSHGDPGSRTEEFVPTEEIQVTDYGMNERDLYELADAVMGALAVSDSAKPFHN